MISLSLPLSLGNGGLPLSLSLVADLSLSLSLPLLLWGDILSLSLYLCLSLSLSRCISLRYLSRLSFSLVFLALPELAKIQPAFYYGRCGPGRFRFFSFVLLRSTPGLFS